MSLEPARRMAERVSSGAPGFAVVVLAVTPDPEVWRVVKPYSLLVRKAGATNADRPAPILRTDRTWIGVEGPWSLKKVDGVDRVAEFIVRVLECV